MVQSLPEVNEDPLTVEGMRQLWPIEAEDRTSPDKLTKWFHSAVPILRYIDWRVTGTGRGYAQTVLPLNETSTNQYITHQAAIMLIAADYTGGIALGALLHQVPIVGIHAQHTNYGAYFWGAKADIKWIRPSCADLICTAHIPEDRHEGIARRFFRGARVLETVRIDMTNKGELVAEANFTYWLQDTEALRRNAFDESRIHPLFDHKQKTSAKLIAGLRALEQERSVSERLFNDPVVETVAGDHGKILAKRFVMVAPQLQSMVAARTRHLDDTVNEFHQGERCQIVNIGAGLDTRLYRLVLPKDSVIFDLDLPTMITNRADILGQLPSVDVTRVEVPIDLQEHNVYDTVLAAPGFDASLMTFVVWEGGSMYFEQKTLDSVLASIGKLLEGNPASRFWMDYVDESIATNTTNLSVVEDFIAAMRSLGEPFVNGFSDVQEYLSKFGLEVIEDAPSSSYISTDDPVFPLYRFCVVQAPQARH